VKPASTRYFLSIEPYKAETLHEKEDEDEEDEEHRRTNCYPETAGQ